MANVTITVDFSDVQKLAAQYSRALELAARRLTERMEEATRDEAPEDTGRLKSLTGITSNVKRKGASWQGEIVITARSERRGPRTGVLHLPDGTEKVVNLRAEKPFNYGEAVVKGRKAIVPVDAKLLRIPVTAKKPLLPGETFISADGKQYRLARSAAATAPNPFPDRAANIVEREVEAIIDAIWQYIEATT